MPILQDKLREAATRLEKLQARTDPEGLHKERFSDNGLLNKSDMRKWVRWWEARGHTTQVDKARGGLYHCHLKLNRYSSATWKLALLRDEPMMYLVRHGTTEANIKDEFRGWEDFELDEQGINEAHEAAEWFLTHKVKPKRIISSPLARAQRTAEIIGAALGVSVETDEKLKPLDVGEYTGKDKDSTWDDFVYYLDHPDEKIPDGDSVNGFARKDAEAVKEYLDEAATNGPIILVFHTSNVVVTDCLLREDEVGMDCRPEEKDIVAPGGIVAVSSTREATPVFKDIKEEEENEDPDKAEHEEYDDEKQASLSKIPKNLSGLAAEARKCSTFEEFQNDFSVQIKHGRYYHVTKDPNFKIDPNVGPRDMSSMGDGGMERGKLMITSHLENWTEYYGDTRPYVALIDMSAVPRKAYFQVNRGFGNEFWVEDPSKAKVVKVMTLAQAKADDHQYDKALLQIGSAEDLEQFYNQVKGIKEQPKQAASLTPWKLYQKVTLRHDGEDLVKELKEKGMMARLVEPTRFDYQVQTRDKTGGVPTLKELVEYMRENMTPWFSSGTSMQDAFYGMCDKVSIWLAAMMGGTKVRGWYMGPIMSDMPSVNKAGHHAHSWVEKDGKIYDPTWWAFTDAKPRIYVFPIDDARYARDEEAETGFEPKVPYKGYEVQASSPYNFALKGWLKPDGEFIGWDDDRISHNQKAEELLDIYGEEEDGHFIIADDVAAEEGWVAVNHDYSNVMFTFKRLDAGTISILKHAMLHGHFPKHTLITLTNSGFGGREIFKEFDTPEQAEDWLSNL